MNINDINTPMLDTDLTYTYYTSYECSKSFVASPRERKVYHKIEYEDGREECEVVLFGCPVYFSHYYRDGTLMVSSTWISNLYETGIFYNDSLTSLKDWLISDGLACNSIKYDLTGVVSSLLNCFVDMKLCPSINVADAVKNELNINEL